MSLLEDIFLGDEAEEAAELERIVEGDEYDERPRSPQDSDANSEKEDEAEEDKRRADPTSGTKAKREIKNPRFVLNPARLTGPRGIQVIPEHFKDFKFKGKGHEKEDLDMVLKKLEHWAYRLYPKFQFEDCLKKIETLGKKRPVTVHLHKIRSDQLVSEETVVQQDSDDEPPPAPQEEDEFDKLLQQQIELARATPASVRKPGESMQTHISDYRSPLNLPSMAPKATSSPSISDEQRERMLLNRRLAEERRLAKTNSGANLGADYIHTQNENKTADVTSHEKIAEYYKNSHVTQNADEEDTMNVDMDYDIQDVNAATAPKPKKNRSQVIDTSDSEEEVDKTRENNKDCTSDALKSQNFEKMNIDFVIENTYAIESKKNRSRVMDSDSSDSDCFVGTTVNHITVDVHKAGSQVYESKNISETLDENRQDIVLNETEVVEEDKHLNENLENLTESVKNDTEISENQTVPMKNDAEISEKQTESVKKYAGILDVCTSRIIPKYVENVTEILEIRTETIENDTEISEHQTDSVVSDRDISEKQTEYVKNITEISDKTESVENDPKVTQKQTEYVGNSVLMVGNDSEISEKSNDFQDTDGGKHVSLENVTNNKENIEYNVVKPTETFADVMDLDFSDDF